ncbi:MAG: galactokinase [Desulfobacteraceae bacterium]|nr:MAG: galactokinase [Desulfobacteraceae bacterium]
MNLREQLDRHHSGTIITSVPCRVDFGGTLDISTFYLPLNRVSPSSVNIALDMRTRVTLTGFEPGKIKISSKGFESAVFDAHGAPYDHPMGLMFAIADYFDAHGVHIRIESSSPPRSALGGSSSAAVAIISGFFKAMGLPMDPARIAWLAHYIESSVAGVPCGMQDQLAAAFGGVNQWTWKMGRVGPEFDRHVILDEKAELTRLESHLMVAYCGNPHVSKDINQRWVQGFIAGENRSRFREIAKITQKFAEAVKSGDWRTAAGLMNLETGIRLEMTPDVLDNMGQNMFDMAKEFDCGVRFTGAGGGGCIWSIGETHNISQLRNAFVDLTSTLETSKVLDTRIDPHGILVHE